MHASTLNPITLGPLVVIQNVSSFIAARTRYIGTWSQLKE